MATGASDYGEEYVADQLDGTSFSLMLYNDSTDSLGETGDVGDVTTEPSGSNYSRQTETFNSADLSGDWGLQNANSFSFDTSDSSQTVDTIAILKSFDSNEAGDGGSASTHILVKISLSSSRNLSNFNSVDYDAGDLDFKFN